MSDNWTGTNGTLSGDWNNSANWSAGVPGTADTAFFETGSSIPYAVSGPGTPAEVVLQGDQVTISGSIAPAGTLGLDIEGGGALTVASGAAFSDPAGAIDVGASSAGTLIGDGLVSSYVLDIGREGTTGSGTVTVSGSAASLTVSTGLYMEGGSTLDIAGGATATTGFASIGLGSVNNLLDVSGLGSTLNATGGGGLNVLGGTLDVANGGTVLASAGGIGIGDGSPGGGTLALDDSAQVSGALFLSEATLTALDAIGQSGTGTASLSGAVGLGIGGSDVLQATALTALDLGGNVSGASGLDVAGGAVRLGGADDTYSGATTLFAGTLDLANTTGAGTGTIAFNAPGTTGLPGPTAGLRFYAGDATLRIESGGTLANAILLGSEIVTLSGTVATGTVAGAVGTIETASGTAVTLAGSIADLMGTVFANGTSTVETVPGTLVAGGDVVLADAANSYSGGTTIDAGTLELKQPGVAGSGQISFAPHAGATLKLDGTVLPGNAIAGFAPGDTIDLANETVSSATFRNGTLTLDNGPSLVGTLALAETNAVSPFVVRPDGTGGTDIFAGFAWDQPAGGAFATGGNWTPAGPPGTADYAFFDTGATAPYTVSGDGTPGDIEVDGDQVTLSGSLAPQGVAPLNVPDIGVLFPLVQIEQGGVLTVAAGATISNPTQGGALFVGGDGSGTLAIAGLVDTGNSNAEIGGDAVFSAAGDAEGTATGPGVAVVSGPSATWNLFELDVGAGQGGGNGTVSIADGGRIVDQTGRIGVFAAGAVTVTGPGSGWVNQSVTLDQPNAVLTIANGGSVGGGTLDFGVANQFFGGTVALDDTATLTGDIIMANGLLEAIDASGQSGAGTVTLDNAIQLAAGAPALNEVEGTGHTALDLAGAITGSGTLTAAGGDVILAGTSNTYAGGSAIAAGTLELGAPGGAGSGAIGFQAGAAGTLKIDGSADLPANTIDGFTGSDLIDLPFLAYAPGATTATVNAGTLTLSDGSGTVALNVGGIASGTTLVTTGDGSGGTDITALAGAAAETATGSMVLDGTTTNRDATDQITVFGPLNTIDTFGGNEIITGGSMAATGVDDATYIHISTTLGVAPPSNAGVIDAIDINGGNDTLTADGTIIDEAKSAAAGHTVTAQVANFATATVSFTIAGQYSTLGGDYAGIDNAGGTNSVLVDGPSDVLYVNDDATNVITTGPTAGYTYLYMDSPELGSPENVGAGFTSTITMGGNGNYVFGSEADHDIMISGTVNGTVFGNNDDVTLGNGNNTVDVTGTANQIILGNGSNTVDAGSGNALVALEFFGKAATPGTDTVTLGGGFNQVFAPQTANLTVTGAPLGGNAVGPFIGGGVTYVADGSDSVTLGGGSNQVALGDGNDTVSLTAAAGGNSVALGNGNDSATVSGPSNVIALGGGNDMVTVSGSGDRITFSGFGTDTVQMNATGGSVLQLGSGSASVTGTGTNNAISASDGAGAAVVINLGSADGDVIGLGNGNDTLTSEGSNTAITLGSGNDDITDNGDAVSITAGNGNDTIDANGGFATISLGAGNDSVMAMGTSDTVTLNAASTSSDALMLGANATGTVANGVDDIMFGNADTFDLASLQAGSQLTLGSADMVFLAANADAKATFSGSGDTVVISGSSTYTGQVELTNFSSMNTLDLQNLVGADGERINGLQPFYDNTQMSGGSAVLMLSGGGKVVFDVPVSGGFTTADLKFA